MKDQSFAIVGAGIGGLAAGLALQRAGFRVAIYEQTPQLSEVGAGLSLSPTAARALNHLGLKSVLDANACKPDVQCIRHFKDASPLVWINRGQSLVEQYGERYYTIHRADLHDGLKSALLENDANCIHLNKRCRKITQHLAGVAVEFEDGSKIEADALVGADGSRSSVRHELFGPMVPQYAGYIAWRGLVPMHLVPPEIMQPPSAIFLGNGHVINRYPIRNGELLNFVAFAEREAWSAEGWSIRSTVDELLREFEGWTSWVLRFMELVPTDQLFKWGLFDLEPLQSWTKGRVGLLGDAAHPVLPFLGYGAALAIEDAVVLARAFLASNGIQEGFSRYETARRERAAFVSRESRKAGKQFHVRDASTYRERSGNRAADEGLGLYLYDPVTQPV